MNIATILGVALRSLRRALLRSTLTALGVIVGVASIVATASIGNGARASIQEILSKPESRTIFLTASVPQPQNRRIGRRLTETNRLKLQDYDAIRRNIARAAAVSPRFYVSAARVKANGISVEAVTEGIDSAGFTTMPRRLLEGALFSTTDVRLAASVCVISESLARAVFSSAESTGRVVRINDVSFTVIGVVDDVTSNNAATLGVRDLHIYVPFSTVKSRIDMRADMHIAVQAHRIEDVSLLQRDISDLMEQRRSGRTANFVTFSSLDSIKAYSDSALTLARLLAAFGVIALIVGGIGIMNIMLVSVTERTREIGIRMAVGTRQRDVLVQVLIEAGALSLLGGAVGVMVGGAAAHLITQLYGWPTELTVATIIAAFICSLSVGVLFGLQPARRAASVRPVQALRAD